MLPASCPLNQQLVRQLLARGNTVLATARKPAAADDLIRLRDAHADRLHISELDVASPQSIQAFAADAKARLPHVDVRTQAAGLVWGSCCQAELQLSGSWSARC